MNLYFCLTDVIATFHSLSESGATIGGYLNIVLITSAYTFFLSKNITCNLSVSTFMARALNSTIKSAMFFFPCLKVLIFYSASVALVLLLNVFFISCTKSFQSWVPISLSSSLSFFWAQIPTMSPLRQARIAVILLLLRNNLIPLYQFLNFVLSSSNHPRSGTMFLGTLACLLFSYIGTNAVDISSVYSVILPKASFVICKDPSHSDNTSISLS